MPAEGNVGFIAVALPAIFLGLEESVTDHKWYAPGVGCVKDGDMPLAKIVAEEMGQ